MLGAIIYEYKDLFLVTLVNSLWSKSRGLTLQLTVAMKDGQNRSDHTRVRACGVHFHKWLWQRRKTETFASALIQETL